MAGIPATVSVLRWAAERARLTDAELEERFRKWPLWLCGEAMPTLRQLEEFARVDGHPAAALVVLRCDAAWVRCRSPEEFGEVGDGGVARFARREAGAPAALFWFCGGGSCLLFLVAW
jgi:hypothetical protein